jgi:hypothetical protein
MADTHRMLTSLITGLFALGGGITATATETWSSLPAFNARYRMREVGGVEVLVEHATRVRELRFELDDNGTYDRHVAPAQ